MAVPAPEPSNPRPLIVRFGALGEMVLLTVLIRALARRFGAPVDLVASGSWTLPLLVGQPGVGEVHVIGSRRRPYWLSGEQRALVALLRARGAGPTWYCDLDDKGRWLLRAAGIPDGLIIEARRDDIRPQEHFADYWQRIAALTPPALAASAPSVTVEAGPPRPALEVPAGDRAGLDAWLRTRGIEGDELILVQVGNKRTMRWGRRSRASNTKYWPSGRWAALLRGLREQHPAAPILLLGVAAEAGLNAEIAALAAVPGLFNLAGDLPIGRLLALQSRAIGMISVDTGPAHAGAAVDCPLVVLFGEASPVNYAPRGPHTEALCLTGQQGARPSMLGIEAPQVLEAWRALMRRSGGRRVRAP